MSNIIHFIFCTVIVISLSTPGIIDDNIASINITPQSVDIDRSIDQPSTNIEARYQSNLGPNSVMADVNEDMKNRNEWIASQKEVVEKQKEIIPELENFIPVSTGSVFQYYVGPHEFNYDYIDSNSPVVKMSDNKIEYVVKTNSDFNLRSFESINTISEIEIVKYVPRLNAYVIKIPLGDIDQFNAEVPSLDGFKYLEPHFYRSLNLVPDDPRWTDQWGPQLIGMESAWDYNIGNRSVIVGVIDTGIDYTHPELTDAYLAKGYDWYNDDNDPFDDHYHGTHVSGTIAAAIDNGIGVSGIANVSIFGEKIFGDDGSFAGDIDAAAAIDHAVAQGADILSNSWGGTGYSQLLADAVSNAIKNGTMVVAAAGNSGTNTVHYPAAYPGVIAVSATNSADNLASFSNYGDWINIAAPGVNILSTYPITKGSYNSISGTSMATPHVSGLLALIISQFPDYTLTQVEQVLYLSADDLGDPGFDAYFGNGRVNASKAMLGIPEHEIAVTLRAPYKVKQSSNVTISSTIYNKGKQDEANVKFDFYLENTIVNSTTISNLSVGSSYTLTYEWHADSLGNYNLTAYSPLIIGERYSDNNLRYVSVEVLDTKLVGVVTAHGESYPTSIVNFYTDVGFIVVDIPTLPNDFSSYDLIIVTEGGSTWPVSDLTILNNYLQNDGHVAAFGDSGLHSLSWISNYGLSFTYISPSIGYTTHVKDHYLTYGVLEMYA
ncbi:MAG: S8 family serine peptidase, partial [Candidatus Kariarchaeaceae archaeon]